MEKLREWDSIRDYYAERGSEGAVEVDYGYDWWEGRDRYRISYNPETGDVYAREVTVNGGGAGEVLLIGEGIFERETVDSALWLDDAGDEVARFARTMNDRTTTLAWAVERLTVGMPSTIAPPDGTPPGVD